jgi:hypothetical protein
MVKWEDDAKADYIQWGLGYLHCRLVHLVDNHHLRNTRTRRNATTRQYVPDNAYQHAHTQCLGKHCVFARLAAALKTGFELACRKAGAVSPAIMRVAYTSYLYAQR